MNVTAGTNLTMREFDEIGRIIHDFASEDATVVIGTSLDPEMKDDVRVTVVATGLASAMGDAPRSRCVWGWRRRPSVRRGLGDAVAARGRQLKEQIPPFGVCGRGSGSPEVGGRGWRKRF
ncbi:Cell division protein FtsZ [Rhodanobacter lindaniclasticus]